MLGSSYHFQHLNATFVMSRRNLADGRQPNKHEYAERGTLDISKMKRCREWTSEEEAVIDRASSDGLSWRQCVPLLAATRTASAVQRRYGSRKHILRLQSGAQNDTSDNIKLITKLVASGLTKSEIRIALPHMSLDNIQSIALYRGLKIKKTTQAKGPRWSASEDDIIRQEVRNGFPDSISLVKLLPGRTFEAIEKRAAQHRQARFVSAIPSDQKRRWTAEEEKIAMSKFSDGVPVAKIAEMLSRTYQSIEQKLASLRRQRLTPDR